MGLINFFSKKSYETLEEKGDDFFNTGAYGHAKITYEKALHKLEKKSSEPSAQINRLQKKLLKARRPWRLSINKKEKSL